MTDMIISKILVAVDGSTPSLDADGKLSILLKKYGADLNAIHAISSNIRSTRNLFNRFDVYCCLVYPICLSDSSLC